MYSSVDALKEIVAMVDKTTAEFQYMFDTMPGDIVEKCTGMWSHLPRSTNSSNTDVSSPTTKDSSTVVNMSASTASCVSSKASSVFTTEEMKLYQSVDKKEVLATYWIESEQPIDDDEMRAIEKSLLG